jgi:hypothetical protein
MMEKLQTLVAYQGGDGDCLEKRTEESLCDDENFLNLGRFGVAQMYFCYLKYVHFVPYKF